MREKHFSLVWYILKGNINTETTRGSSNKWTKRSVKIIYILSQTSVRLCKISSQKISFLETPNDEKKCSTSYETLESTGEMKQKLMLKFTCVCTISKFLKFSFSRSHGKLFSVLFDVITFVFNFKKM